MADPPGTKRILKKRWAAVNARACVRRAGPGNGIAAGVVLASAETQAGSINAHDGIAAMTNCARRVLRFASPQARRAVSPRATRSPRKRWAEGDSTSCERRGYTEKLSKTRVANCYRSCYRVPEVTWGARRPRTSELHIHIHGAPRLIRTVLKVPEAWATDLDSCEGVGFQFESRDETRQGKARQDKEGELPQTDMHFISFPSRPPHGV